jgi:hypothetical protein
VPGKDFEKSLDSITVKCPASGRTYTLQFTYERDLTAPGDLITGFTVTINDAPTS